MVVYADILIFLNTVINFLLLKITGKLCGDKNRFIRSVAAAFAGGLFSLYILIRQTNFIIELSVRIVVSAIMAVISFGVKSIKLIFKQIVILFGLSFLFAGIMISFWFIFKPDNLLINNGIVYFDVSPIVLIGMSVIAYFFVSVVMFVLKRRIRGDKYCRVTLKFGERCEELIALLDTGHALRDTINGSPVVIVDKKYGERLFGEVSVTSPTYLEGQLKKRYRIIPYNTIGGSGIMPAFKCDSATAVIDGKSYKTEQIIAAISNTEFGDSHNAIINPNIFTE